MGKEEKKDTTPASEEVKPDTYVYIDDYLATKTDLSEYDKAGFKVYMEGGLYQHSFEDFEKQLPNFFNRPR